MSILIKGIEMPTKGNPITVLIYPDGTAEWQNKEGTAVPVPLHGRLIDADALVVELMDRGVEGLQTDDWHEIQQAVADAPTIIPASEEGER